MDTNQELNARFEALRRACDLHLQNNTRLPVEHKPVSDSEVAATAKIFYEFLTA